MRLKAKPWVPRGKSAADAITTVDFIGTESSGWQTWTSVDRAAKYAEGCALRADGISAFCRSRIEVACQFSLVGIDSREKFGCNCGFERTGSVTSLM